MQKKIIALAIAAVISAPAFADNTNFSFYGTADVSNDFVTTGDGTAAANSAVAPIAGTTKRVVSSNTSKFGFKGSEDLGDGLAAIWQVEQQVDIDNAANTFGNRNTFAGLKDGSYGTVLMGRHDTPYKIAVRKLDVFADGIADNRALLGFKAASNYESRRTDVLAYISPAFSGVTVAAATVNLTETAVAGTTATNSAFSAAAMYDVAPFYGSLAYESHILSASSTATILDAKESATRVGFGFKANGIELNAVYESTTDNLGPLNASLYGHTAYYVGGKYLIGADAVKLAYGNAGAYNAATAAAGANTGATQVSIGYDHPLSKRTTVYALYTKIANGAGANYGFSQNTASATSVNGFGGTPTAISLGLKHTF
jgi:predicted porin